MVSAADQCSRCGIDDEREERCVCPRPVTMGATAAWKDCPKCRGTGMWQDLSKPGPQGWEDTLPLQPCPLCAKFHAAVKAAVDAEREACAKLCEYLESDCNEYDESKCSDAIRNRRNP